MRRLPLGVVLCVVVAGCMAQATISPTPNASLGPAPTPTSCQPPSTCPLGPTPTIDVGPDGFPTSVLGLPVLTVEAASTLLLNGSLDGRFAAVGGYWYPYALPCAYQPHIAPLAERCGFGVLVDQPVDNPFGGSFSAEQVQGRISPAIVAESAANFSFGGDKPHVVAIIHVADGRLWQCAADDVTFCKRRPVFDRLVWLDGADVDPSQFQPVLPTMMSFDAAMSAASAAAGGSQVVLAYPLPTTAIQDVDPRFSGQGHGIVWYARVITGTPDANGSAAGEDVLINDESGEIVKTLPLQVDAAYSPARLVLDSNGWEASGEARARYRLFNNGSIVSEAWLDSSSAPLALDAGGYTVSAYIGTDLAVPTGEPSCDLPLALIAGDDLGYYADYANGGCTWKEGEWPFN